MTPAFAETPKGLINDDHFESTDSKEKSHQQFVEKQLYDSIDYNSDKKKKSVQHYPQSFINEQLE